MEIDFDKLLNDYLERIKKDHPNPDDNPYITMSNHTATIAAKVCISILKEYESLKSQDS